MNVSFGVHRDNAAIHSVQKSRPVRAGCGQISQGVTSQLQVAFMRIRHRTGKSRIPRERRTWRR